MKAFARAGAFVLPALLAALPVFAGSFSARAADGLAQVQPPPLFSWTGFYIGVNGGYQFGSFTRAGEAAFGDAGGATLGGTAGYNQQFGNIVAGLEGDLNWTGARGNQRTTAAGTGRGGLDVYGSLRGRVGLVADRALFFATAGYAGAQVTADWSAPGAPSQSQRQWQHGYALGAGVEYALSSNLSAKAEYIFSQYGPRTYFGAPSLDPVGVSLSTVRAGINYRF